VPPVRLAGSVPQMKRRTIGIRRSWVFLAAAVACLVAAILARPANPGTDAARHLSTLRLLQFNVLNGATGGRAAGVAAVIKASGADVVTLDEVNVRDIFNQIAASLGFHSYFVPGNDGYSVGILARFPIRRCFSYTQAPIQHAAYGCRIAIQETNWWIFGAHLACCDQETVRSQEAGLLISKMNEHPSDPVVLAGDLNSQTPGENDQTPLLVIPSLRRAGYIDSFRELFTIQQDSGFTVSAPPFGTWERRLDYVFHNRRARATSARVISSVSGYTWPSDHAALAVKLINRPPKSATR
jgi:endonuclease/exonuclease/phosphatase (EEP) superfamily protein YafD